MKFFTCISITFFTHLCLVVVFSLSFKKGLAKNIILKTSMQVNLVALPEKKAISIEKPKKDKAILWKNKKTKKRRSKLQQKNILKKIQKRLRKKQQKNILKKIKNTKQKKTEKNSNTRAGNQLSSVLQNQIQNYSGQLKRHVHSFWSIPQWVDPNNLKVEIIVYLNKNGELLQAKYFSKSSNEDFNTQAFNALSSASPYPYPPEALVDVLEDLGIVFSFP